MKTQLVSLFGIGIGIAIGIGLWVHRIPIAIPNGVNFRLIFGTEKEESMKMKKLKAIACILTLMLVVSIVSSQHTIIQTHALAQASESQAIGGGRCATAWGFSIALGVATLSGCGIVCATAAWYSLALLSGC
jgi:hypothetical protein